MPEPHSTTVPPDLLLLVLMGVSVAGIGYKCPDSGVILDTLGCLHTGTDVDGVWVDLPDRAANIVRIQATSKNDGFAYILV